MPHSYYVVHLEEKDKINNIIYAQLKCFAYPGAFASSVWDEFDLKDYDLHPVEIRQFINRFNPVEQRLEQRFLRLSEIVSVGNNTDYTYILNQCKAILMERNPNINENKIQ